MTALYQYSMPTGVISADTADLLADVQNEFRNALGATINVAASTPQGTLITTETIARTDVMRNNAEFSSLLNPNYSYGVFLDAIGAFTNTQRGHDVSTVLEGVSLEGVAGKTVPKGYRMRIANGTEFETLDDYTFASNGVVFGNFKSVSYGDIAAPVQRCTIIDGVIGWGAVEIVQSTVVIPGSVALKDGAYRNSRRQRLFNLGQMASRAIRSRLLGVPNVISVNVIENNTGAAGNVNGVDFTLPSALWVCIDGNPNDADIARAAYSVHRTGCPWDFGVPGEATPVNPPTGVPTVDPYSGITSYVKWSKAKLYDAYVRIIVRQGTSITNALTVLPQLCVDYASGNISGEEGFVVGADLSSFDLSGAISGEQPGLFLKSVLIAAVPKGDPAPEDSDFTTFVPIPSYGVAKLVLGNVRVTQE